jgi:hypothetical protein
MALSIELLKAMEPGHAINALRADFDPLVNSPLEAFLIDWIESLVDDGIDYAPLIAAADNAGYEPKDIEALTDALIGDVPATVALLEALTEAGIDTPAALTAKLERADKFYDIAQDAGDVFTRLTQLVETTL